MQSNPIDLNRLKLLLHNGLAAIPQDDQNNQAILFIGDTGVGKSTIMSFLLGNNLVIRYQGLKPTLDNISSQTRIKIGHDKYSQTSIPTKVVIDKMAFYDCPGFKDNKGEEYEISNSFFVQRLLDLYERVKIVLIIDQSHISQTRADKLPKLLRNLYKSFKSFDQIKDGVCLIINRAASDHTVEDYNKQIGKFLKLKNQNGFLFQEKQQQFLQFLINNNRILLFKQAGRTNSRRFQPGSDQKNMLLAIKEMQFVKSKHIQNILSQSAKLAIRDFIDDIAQKSNVKIQQICKNIIYIYNNKVQTSQKNLGKIITLKDEIVRLAQQIKNCKKEEIVRILQRQLPRNNIIDFQQDFTSILFFKSIYDKTHIYFTSLVNKIYSQLSYLLSQLDQTITVLQKQQLQELKRQKQAEQQRIRQKQREIQRLKEIQRLQQEEQRRRIEIEKQRLRQQQIRRLQEEEQQKIRQMQRQQQRIIEFKRLQQAQQRRILQIQREREKQRQQQKMIELKRLQQIQQRRIAQIQRQKKLQQQRIIEMKRLQQIQQRNIALTQRQKKIQQQRIIQRKKLQQLQQKKIKDMQRQQQHSIALQHAEKMDNLTQNLSNNKKNLIQEIRSTIQSLTSVEQELKRVKLDAVNLKKLSKQIDSQFQRIESTYFIKRVVR